jgi:hypothetical protein
MQIVNTQQESAHSTTQIGTAQWCLWDANIKNQCGLRNQQKKTITRTEPNWDGLGGELNSWPININEGDNKIRRLPRAGVRAQRRRINANCFQFEFLPRSPPARPVLHAKFQRCAAAE